MQYFWMQASTKTEISNNSNQTGSEKRNHVIQKIISKLLEYFIKFEIVWGVMNQNTKG